jgi:hypothetical protein
MPIRYTKTAHLDHPTPFVYDFMVANQPANHSRWEPEVLELRFDGPIAAGTKGVMVRRDLGKVKHAPLEILEVVPGKRSRVVSDHSGVRFEYTLDLEPDASGDGTDLKVTIEVTLSGALRLLQPLLALVFRRNSARILGQLRVALAEAAGVEGHPIEREREVVR